MAASSYALNMQLRCIMQFQILTCYFTRLFSLPLKKQTKPTKKTKNNKPNKKTPIKPKTPNKAQQQTKHMLAPREEH